MKITQGLLESHENPCVPGHSKVTLVSASNNAHTDTSAKGTTVRSISKVERMYDRACDKAMSHGYTSNLEHGDKMRDIRVQEGTGGSGLKEYRRTLTLGLMAIQGMSLALRLMATQGMSLALSLTATQGMSLALTLMATQRMSLALTLMATHGKSLALRIMATRRNS